MPRKSSKKKSRQKRDIYCGNNGINRDLVNGNKVVGTRYECMKKGIGIGLNMPVDPEYLSGYVPIDNTRVYCGKAGRKPGGYDRMGNNPECLRKGVGQGKLIKARRQRRGAASFSMNDNSSILVSVTPYDEMYDETHEFISDVVADLKKMPDMLFFVDEKSGYIGSVLKEEELEFWNEQKDSEFINFSIWNKSFHRDDLKKILEGDGNVFVLSEK